MKYIEFPELARLSQALTHEGPECSVHTRIEAYSCKNINRDKRLFRALEHAYAEEMANAPSHPPPAHLSSAALREQERANAIGHIHSAASSPAYSIHNGHNGRGHASQSPSRATSSYAHISSSPPTSRAGASSPTASLTSTSVVSADPTAEPTPFGPMTNPAARKTLYLLIAALNVAFPDHDFADVRPSAFNREESGASVLHALSETLAAPHRPGIRAPRTYSSYPPPAPGDTFPASSSSPVSGWGVNGYTVYNGPGYNGASLSPRQSPLAPSPLVAGTHPTLYRMLDDIIGLADCEVFSYVPDIASDPHATDYSDPEDDAASVGSSDASAEEEEAFAFDDYDVDEARGRGGFGDRYGHEDGWRSGRRRTSADTDTEAEDGSPLRVRLRRRGALLWSSHWFFLNRKLKRILFISICARTKAPAQWTSDDSDEGYNLRTGVSASPEKYTYGGERFRGWEGAVGAGARAMGLAVRG